LAGVVRGIPEEEGRFLFLVEARSRALLATKELQLPVEVPQVARQNAIAEILQRGPALTLEEERYLDIVGNHNGRFDIGDVYLLLKGGDG
jgi:hypothetical protein